MSGSAKRCGAPTAMPWHGLPNGRPPAPRLRTQTESRRRACTRLDHVATPTSDVGRLIAFYKQLEFACAPATGRGSSPSRSMRTRLLGPMQRCPPPGRHVPYLTLSLAFAAPDFPGVADAGSWPPGAEVSGGVADSSASSSLGPPGP